MQFKLSNASKNALFCFSCAFTQACGLGTASTSAQNNSNTATPTSTSGTLATTASVNDSGVENTPAVASTPSGTVASPTPTVADPASPNETLPTASPTTPANANQTMQNPNQTNLPNNFYETSTLTTSAFSWNEQSGAFTLILSTDRAVCAMRTANSVKTNSRELQITATVLQKGSALTIQNMIATMVLFDGSCSPQTKATAAVGASKLELNNLNSSSVTGDYLFSLTTGGTDGAHSVAGTFSAPSCSGLSNGVPAARVCLR